MDRRRIDHNDRCGCNNINIMSRRAQLDCDKWLLGSGQIKIDTADSWPAVTGKDKNFDINTATVDVCLEMHANRTRCQIMRFTSFNVRVIKNLRFLPHDAL